MKFYQSFKFKFLVIISFFVLLAGFSVAFTSAYAIKTLCTKGYSNQVISIVNEARMIVDPAKFASVANKLDDTDPDYIEQCEALLALKSRRSCLYLYTMKPLGGSNAMYVFDGSAEKGDEGFSELGDKEDISSYGSAPFDCMDKKQTILEKMVYQDDWGWTISAYTPIIDAKGEAVGFIGCDYNMQILMESFNKSLVYVTMLCLTLLPIVLVVIFFFTRPFFEDLMNVTKSLDKISKGKGDLTAKIETQNKGEVGLLAQTFNAVLEKLREMMETIKQSTVTLAETSEQLLQETDSVQKSVDDSSKTIIQIMVKTRDQTNYMDSVVDGIKKTENEIDALNDGLHDMTSGAQETAHSINKMSATVENVSDGITKIADYCENLVKATETGRTLQKNVSSQIEVISNQAKDLLSANQAITSISSKTNLLAMNASIEAAHAGEAGKGFAVVAGEIRTLAENSAKQTDAINKLLSSVTAAIEGIVTASNESTKSFDGIGNQIAEIDKMMHDMQSSMNAQSESIRSAVSSASSISDKIKELNKSSVTMKNQSKSSFAMIDTLKDSSQDIARSIGDIASQMDDIKNLVYKAAEISTTNKNVTSDVSGLVNAFKTA